jgi:hypothetical protein
MLGIQGRQIYLPAIQLALQHLKTPLPGQRTIFSSLKCYKVTVYEASLPTPALKREAFSCKSTPLHAHIIPAPPGGKPLNNIQDNKELMPRLHINLYIGGDST